MIELASQIWYKLLIENRIPKNGVIIEVAPGYEPKIGNALSLFGFCGTVYIIEPDSKAADHIKTNYQKILPEARIFAVAKLLQEVEVDVDVPLYADALVSSHPFDDMVMSFIFDNVSFFEEEKKGGTHLATQMEKLYKGIKTKDYLCGIEKTLYAWKNFILKFQPACFIASQYPSRTLEIKGLLKRQESGFTVLRSLKEFYKKFLSKQRRDKSFGFKGNPKWWIAVRFSPVSRGFIVRQKPAAIKRLGKAVFIAQKARQLLPEEYEIVYAEKPYSKIAREFAVEIGDKNLPNSAPVAYADRQKDKTGIGLSGNLGSGRAVYYGEKFNILGVGRTSLCRSPKHSHSTGRAELVGCMRRLILSKWINYFTKRAPEHPVLISLKKTARFKWSSSPIPLALLVRVDNGDLDRPSHVEFSPNIPVDFKKTLAEYAKLDAEFFAYRMMLGAWSTSNYSLNGKIIDLESASFVKYRAPYYTSTSKYPHNRFCNEGLGFSRILRQLADAKGIGGRQIKRKFYAVRRRHLGLCFLALLGISKNRAKKFFSNHKNYVIKIADKFEKLSKKIGPGDADLNLYKGFLDEQDPGLLDMSNLFRNMAELYRHSDAEEKAFAYLVRKDVSSKIKKNIRIFIRALLKMVSMLDAEKCLNKKSNWERRLRFINQDLPPMFKLNCKLKDLAEKYRLGALSAEDLGMEITKLCKFPLFYKK